MTAPEKQRAEIKTTAQVDPGMLHDFLRDIFGTAKSEFLRDYGDWWHGGHENRWVLMVDEEIAGYCAVIPTKTLVRGKESPAIWWVDLVIAPKYRGKGLQSLFDEKIKLASDLKLGFPNILAAKIHKKHGWGVIDDYKVLLFPIHPLRMKRVRKSTGLGGLGLKAGAFVLTPVIAGIRWGLGRYQPKTSRRIETPSSKLLAEIFLKTYDKHTSTTLRDEAYFQQRFFSAPQFEDLKFYTSGPQDSPSHFLITRDTHFQGIRAARVLDFYGDFSDQTRIKDLFYCALKDMILAGSSQAIIIVTIPGLDVTLRKLGFFIQGATRFCWQSEDHALMEGLNDMGYWTFADSDNDAPD